jgi:hypothetical protein
VILGVVKNARSLIERIRKYLEVLFDEEIRKRG